MKWANPREPGSTGPWHIWAESWNEGAVYSPDGMTIQFDNGTVWRRNIELLVLPSAPPRVR